MTKTSASQLLLSALFLGSTTNILNATEVVKSFGSTPLAFEPNRGQWPDPKASFGTYAPGFSVLFSASEFTYLLQNYDQKATVKARWAGSSSFAREMKAVDRLPGVANYYVGADQSRWISGLPAYRRIRVDGIYRGIDLIYYGNGQKLEYDLEVAPGADPGRIALAFDGRMPIVDARGDLIVETNAGPLVQHRPTAYQEIGGIRIPVVAQFVVSRKAEVKLALGPYHHGRKLIIDPTIQWSVTANVGATNVLAVDSSGNVYVAGPAYLPTRIQESRAYFAKLGPDGSTLYSIHFGGRGGESVAGIVVDASGDAILAGTTRSRDMVTKNAYQPTLRGVSDAFIAKFSPEGDLLLSTFLGGSGNEQAAGLAIDPAGSVYVTGSTDSMDFPTAGSAYQSRINAGFLTKFSADGSSLALSTYFPPAPSAIALGPDGSVVIAANTYAADLPTSANAFQSSGNPIYRSAYISRLSTTDASLIDSTYIAAANSEVLANSIDVDSTGAVYVSGSSGDGFPARNALQASFSGIGYRATNGFLTKLSPDGFNSEFSTYISGTTQSTGVRIGPDGNATVVGLVQSPDFPTVAAFLPQPGYGFVAEFNTGDNTLAFSSFLWSAPSWDQNLSGTGPMAVGLDRTGGIYVGGKFITKISGPTDSIPITVDTAPTGLQVAVDGVTLTAPRKFLWAPGVVHQLDASVSQSQGTNLFHFLSWSNFTGSNTQNMFTPDAASTFTAVFETKACQYKILPPDISAFGQTGGNSAISINTQAGCLWPWPPSVSASWIKPGSSQGSGAGSMPFTVAANPTNDTRSATIIVGDSTFPITQGFVPPTVTCPYGCNQYYYGLAGSFQYSVTDFDGSGDIAVSKILVNGALDGNRACYLSFDHRQQILYLANDDGTWENASTLRILNGRGVGVVENGQCSVSGLSTSITQTATAQTLSIGIAFKPSFAGNKLIYSRATDAEGLDTGWQVLGTWTIPGATTYPAVISGRIYQSTPANISVVFQDETANQNLTQSQILINDSLNLGNACYLQFDHTANLLYLATDAGTGLLPPITPGVGTATQNNSQCIIYAQNSSVQPNGSSYELNVQVFFLPAFRGQRLLYGATQTKTGSDSGWQPLASFIVQ